MTESSREQKLQATRTRMAELAARFLERTATDIMTMRGDLDRLSSDPAALEELRHLAHRMVGTGATLGFESLSGYASRIEQLAESCAPGAMPDEPTRRHMGLALQALEEEFLKQRA